MTSPTSGPKKFRKRPVVIEALRYTAENAHLFAEWMGYQPVFTALAHGLPDMHIDTLEGTMTARPGWWIIKGIHGEFYPCEPAIFAATYEEYEEPKL